MTTIRSLSFLMICLMSIGLKATVYNCSTTQEIIDALALVQAGDEIVISSGTYISSTVINASFFYSDANGTATDPIIIRSTSSANKAHLQGSDIASGTVLRIEGDYWIVKDLEISTGLKALVFDNSQYSEAINCDIHNTGNEALHVRDGSDHVTIDACNIYNTGNVNPGYGEGIYIGTDKGSWDNYDPYVDHTTVKNCSFGPNVRAEALDIKEGTQETIIESNTFDGTGISGSNYSDSFIDLKGVRTYVRYNTFNRNNAVINKGVAVINRSVELSSYKHTIHDNVFNMDIASYNVVEAYAGTSEVYAWNNTRNPSGDIYNSRVIESCPSWYNLCSGNQLPSVTLTSPQNADTFTDGDDITISANASDADGSVTSVRFYTGTTLIGEDLSSPYSLTWNNVSTGNYSLTAVATDDSNTTATSPAVSIVVNSSTPASALSLQYYASDTDIGNNKIRPYLKIVNSDAGVVPYEDLTIRYWFTKEEAASLLFQCDFADIDAANVNGAFSALSPAQNGADHYLEVSFDAAAGNLGGNTNSGQIKLRITTSDLSNFDETNDHSYNPIFSSYDTNENITLYQNGNLVWGTEPASVSAGNNLSLEYYSADSDPNNNKIRPYLQIVNNDAVSVPYEDLKIRYWLTEDVTSSLQFKCDDADLGTSSVNGEFHSFASSDTQVDHYLEVSFDAASGSLNAGSNSGKIKLRITNSTNTNFDESNDYSFDGSISNYQTYDKIGLYQNDVLIWGTAPNSSSPRIKNVLSTNVAKSDISIFPNPTTDFLTILTKDNWAGGSVEICSVSGQKVYAERISKKENELFIDTSTLKTGYYMVILQNGNMTQSRKILKR